MATQVREKGHDVSAGTEYARVEEKETAVHCFSDPITRPILFSSLKQAAEGLRERLSAEYSHPRLQFTLGKKATVKAVDNGLDISRATIEACRFGNSRSMENVYHIYSPRDSPYRVLYSDIQRAFEKIPEKYGKVHLWVYPRRLQMHGVRKASQFLAK